MDKELNVVSMFDGVSCGRVALERAGFKVGNYFAYEIEPNAISISKYNYPDIKHMGDVFNADFGQYEDVDLLMGGSPCFVAGTMIRTIDGFKPIENIEVGDKVLTHKNRYKTVTAVMKRNAPSTVIVKAENCGEIECTKEHPFYTREVNRVWNNSIKHEQRILSNDFEWTDPEHFITERVNSGGIKKQTYLTSITDDIKQEVDYGGVDLQVNQFATRYVNDLDLNDENLWYIIGRWLGDGWFKYKYKKTGKKLSGAIICCGKHEIDELEEKMKLANLKYYKNEEKTTYRFTITNLEFALFLKRFGDGAKNKHLSSETYYLHDNLALSFLDGYFDADGHIKNHIGSFTTISKELAYGIKYMINKYLKVSCRIIETIQHSNKIEGRHINVSNPYTGYFHLEKQKQSHYFVEDSYILAPYKSITYLNESKTVYNLSVEDDESYVANGLVVHNCTFWSKAKCAKTAKAGKEIKPEDGEGWDLFQQFVKAKNTINPKYFLYENNHGMAEEIKNAISKELGVEPILIDSQLVSAQRRKRLYWTNIPGITQPEDKGILVKDVICDNPELIKYFDDRIRNTMIKSENYIKYDLGGKGHYSQQDRLYFLNNKAPTVPRCRTETKFNVYLGGEKYKKTCPLEIERLQTLPDNYTEFGIKDDKVIKMPKTRRFEAIGNGWTVDVVAHIFSFIKDI